MASQDDPQINSEPQIESESQPESEPQLQTEAVPQPELELQVQTRIQIHIQTPIQIQTPSQLSEIEDTAIDECLSVVKSEYETERNKKQSFEIRVGLIMTLAGSLMLVFLGQIQLKDVFPLMTDILTFINLIKIIAGWLVYLGFGYTMWMLVKTINVKPHDNFAVHLINESLLKEQRTLVLKRIIFTYRDLILQHRTINEKRAESFKRSLYSILVTFISGIVYITLL